MKREGICVPLVLILAACSQKTTPVPTRIAVLRFENLTSDVSLDWMGRAASEIIAREIGSGKSTVIPAAALHAHTLAQFHPVSAPGASSERDAAVAEGATRLITGNVMLVRGR